MFGFHVAYETFCFSSTTETMHTYVSYGCDVSRLADTQPSGAKRVCTDQESKQQSEQVICPFAPRPIGCHLRCSCAALLCAFVCNSSSLSVASSKRSMAYSSHRSVTYARGQLIWTNRMNQVDPNGYLQLNNKHKGGTILCLSVIAS